MTARPPLFTACPRCGVRVLEVRGDWADDVVFGEPLLDPVGLDYQQVTACIIAGLTLWQLHPYAGHTVTSRRTRWWPRAPMPGLTVPQHVCGRVWDAFPVDLSPDTDLTPELCPF